MPENKKAKGAVDKAASGKITIEDLIFDVTPFTYDGVEYKEIDLNGIRDMTAMQMFRIEKALKEEGYGTSAMWTTVQGAAMVAAAVNSKPREWLNGMKMRDAVVLMGMVSGYFFGAL